MFKSDGVMQVASYLCAVLAVLGLILWAVVDKAHPSGTDTDNGFVVSQAPEEPFGTSCEGSKDVYKALSQMKAMPIEGWDGYDVAGFFELLVDYGGAVPDGAASVAMYVSFSAQLVAAVVCGSDGAYLETPALMGGPEDTIRKSMNIGREKRRNAKQASI